MEDLVKNQDTPLTSAQNELKKRDGHVAKKVRMGTQQQEMASVPKPLQCMLL